MKIQDLIKVEDTLKIQDLIKVDLIKRYKTL